jgi:hypothetical protein
VEAFFILLISTFRLPKPKIEAWIFRHLGISRGLDLLLPLSVFLECRHTNVVVVEELSETL